MEQTTISSSTSVDAPTWIKDVAPLFSAPYWVPADQRTEVAQTWEACMQNFGLDLTNEADVKAQAASIFFQLSQKLMPKTTDSAQYWPQAALDTFQAWANTGFRTTDADPIVLKTTIPFKAPAGGDINPSSAPTWDKDVAPLFSAPYWIPDSSRQEVGKLWYGCMKSQNLDLSSEESVKGKASEIYDALQSRFMPLTSDESQYWPQPALDTFKAWMDSISSPSSTLPAAKKTLLATTPSNMCPFAAGRLSSRVVVPAGSALSSTPTWEDDVRILFAKPYWVNPAQAQSGTGDFWFNCMSFAFDLRDPDSVKDHADDIYVRLASKTMPPIPSQTWPTPAVETFRAWANTGFRIKSTDPVIRKVTIPDPLPPPGLRIRKDILSLTPLELQTYRSKIDDLGVSALGSKWQELGNIHTQWCLHYQEASMPWHRAFVLYIEKLIDFPIPYWNGFAKDSTDPTSPGAGIPSAFLELEYTHIRTGEVRRNPLKFALAADGRSQGLPNSGPWVRRDPVLENGPTDPGFARKVALFTKYHDQLNLALSQSSYSTPEGFAGRPWENDVHIAQEINPDSLYPSENLLNFDGLLEQVHDNYHGWVGHDMIDNSYAAYDPLFFSYHANIDRITELFIASHPEQQYTSGCPLRPFRGPGATTRDHGDSPDWVYTTLGDMARPSPGLGYTYGPPASPDALPASLHPNNPNSNLAVPTGGLRASGGSALMILPPRKFQATIPSAPKTVPYIVFNDVHCTPQSYQIDIFTPDAASLDPDPVGNPGYIGRVTQLGMGYGNDAEGLQNPGRCVKRGVTRVLHAEKWADALRPGGGVKQVVTDLGSGKVIEEKDWKGWKGFQGKVVEVLAAN